MKSIEHLRSHNILFKEIHLKEIPKTAQDVERLYGCPLNQVLKTLLFIGNKNPVLVVLPGDKKVDQDKLKEVTKQDSLRIATPEEVRSITGYTIGGVSPFGLEENVTRVLDTRALDSNIVNIGSGKAEIGIELASTELKKVWDGIIADIT